MRVVLLLLLLLAILCIKMNNCTSPSDISSLAFWFDANDTTTLLDVSGVKVGTGGSVNTWKDKSGNSKDVTCQNGGKPTFLKSNGTSVVRFTASGSDSGTQLRGTQSLGSGSLSYFLLYQWRSLHRTYFIDVLFTLGTEQSPYGNVGSSSTFKTYSLHGVTVNGFTVTPYKYLAVGVTYDSGTNQVIGYYNNAVLGSGTGTSGSIPTMLCLGSWDASWVNSGNPHPEYFADVDIAEVIVYSKVLSTSERSDVFAHLNTKATVAPAPTVKPTLLPTLTPTYQPSQPTSQPSVQPSCHPSRQPSSHPSAQPSLQPTKQPFSVPTSQPTARPSDQPTVQPSSQPIHRPTSQPTTKPSGQPSSLPTSQPSVQPSSQPLRHPTSQPTNQPSKQPSSVPSHQPSSQPSSRPICCPTSQPTSKPTFPTVAPSVVPSLAPSVTPSEGLSLSPSPIPTVSPSNCPSETPSIVPTQEPSIGPTDAPSDLPSDSPTQSPSEVPSDVPTQVPSQGPSEVPTAVPSMSPSAKPSLSPTVEPSMVPSVSPSTMLPTLVPSHLPTIVPTAIPSIKPSTVPTLLPTVLPTNVPSSGPSVVPTVRPSTVPTEPPSLAPSAQPSIVPTVAPSLVPTLTPTMPPSAGPTMAPTLAPSVVPTRVPSRLPTVTTGLPTSLHPSLIPSETPTHPHSVCASLPNSNEMSVIGVAHSFKVVLPLSAMSVSRTGNAYGNISASLPTQDESFLVSISNGNFTRNVVTSVVSAESIFRSVEILKDVNGDRLSDLIIGDPYSSKVYVLFGNNNGLTRMTEGFTIFGETDSDLTGWSVSDAGDVNNDTLSDIIVGAPTARGVGAVYVIYGRTASCDVYLRNLPGSIGYAIYGSQKADFLGVSVSGAGDVNGDGFDDIVVGAVLTSKYFAGGALIVYGGTSIPPNSVSLFTTSDGYFVFGSSYSYTGCSVSGVGDVNRDGHDEVIIGSNTQRLSGISEVFLLLGTSRIRNDTLLSSMTSDDVLHFGGSGMIVSGVDGFSNDVLAEFILVPSCPSAEMGCLVRTTVSSLTFVTPAPTPAPSTSLIPTVCPTTRRPSIRPSRIPSVHPTTMPSPVEPSSSGPTDRPVIGGSHKPSARPSEAPTVSPSREPTEFPSENPSFVPTLDIRTQVPSVKPSLNPTSDPVARTLMPSSVGNGLTREPFATPTLLPSASDSLSKQVQINSGAAIQDQTMGGMQYFVNTAEEVSVYNVMGNNTYIVYPNPMGLLVIQYFNNSNDRIDLTSFTSITAISQLVITAGSVIITLPSDQILRIMNLQPSDIDSSSFVLYKAVKVPHLSGVVISVLGGMAIGIGGIVGIFIVAFPCVGLFSNFVKRRQPSSQQWLLDIVEEIDGNGADTSVSGKESLDLSDHTIDSDGQWRNRQENSDPPLSEFESPDLSEHLSDSDGEWKPKDAVLYEVYSDVPFDSCLVDQEYQDYQHGHDGVDYNQPHNDWWQENDQHLTEGYNHGEYFNGHFDDDAGWGENHDYNGYHDSFPNNFAFHDVEGNIAQSDNDSLNVSIL